MKRFFTYISMLTLAVACNDIYGPEEVPVAPDTPAGVEITFSEVMDNSFVVTVTPKGEASFYSYYVDMADAPEVLDAESLYKVKYSSIAQGTVKWSKEEPSYTFTVDEVSPNATYQVYTVAGSPMGIIGEVCTASVKTSDTVAPGYASYETAANQVMFTFTEAVAYNAEAGAIKVPYYAPYSAAFNTAAEAAGEVIVPADSVVVAGNKALVSVPDLPAGSLWTISIPEGLFVDAVGQRLPAYASAFVMVEDEDGTSSPAPKGFYGALDYVELPMFGALELSSFAEWDTGFAIPLENVYDLAGFSSKKFVTVTYETVTDNSVETVVYTLSPGTDYNVTSLGFVVTLPEEPVVGADVTISVPAGAVYDVFGNDCEAWEHTMKYSYGYALADILGEYVITEASAFYGESYSSALTIVESDNAEKGNVMFTVYDDFECEVSPIYADFDVDAGTLTVPSQQVFGKLPVDDTFYYIAFVSCTVSSEGNVGIGTDPVIFNVESSNAISGPNYYYGLLLLDSEGTPVDFYDVYYSTSAVLAPEGDSAETASVMPFRSYPLNSVVRY